MDIQKILANQLNPAKYNPRKDLKPGDPEYEKLRRSIIEFGYVEPVIWNKQTGNIVGGHQRYKILVELGHQEIDCVVVDLDEPNEKALNVALNKVSGEWDMSLLSDLLKDLKESGFDVSLTGFDATEIDNLFNSTLDSGEVEEDDFDADAAAAEIETPISQYGDVWLLGRHRLMCGDSTSAIDVEKLMDGKKANLVVTDPPYGVDYVGKTKDALKIINDKMSGEQFYQFLKDVYVNLYNITEDGGGIYVFHADTQGHHFRLAMIDAGWKFAQCCVWVKQTMVMGRQDYHWQHEPVLYGWKPTAAHKWHSDRKQTTVWNFDRPMRNAQHPTMKPIELMAYPIKNNTLANCIVVDVFGGSGSTLIACEQTNRICHMMELDQKYADVIVKRYYQDFLENEASVFLLRDGKKIPYREVQTTP